MQKFHTAKQMTRFSFLLSILLLLAQSGCAYAQPKTPVCSNDPVRPRILRTLPHDPEAFTQGLVYASGKLYESTGLFGRSSLRRIDPKDGTVERLLPLDDIFAEGLALMDDHLVVLSLHSERALVFSQQDFTPLAEHAYQGEGWGLATDGEIYYMSNGTDTLYHRNKKFEIIKTVPVRCNGKPLTRLNELEYADGKLYANVWYSDNIYVIDPASGTVTGTIDCTPLVQTAKPRSERDALNGIAYDPAARTFYITGKNWPLMFEVRIPDS